MTEHHDNSTATFADDSSVGFAGPTFKPRGRSRNGGVVLQGAIVVAVLVALAVAGLQFNPEITEAESAAASDSDIEDALAALDAEQDLHRAELREELRSGFAALRAKNDADRVEAERVAKEAADAEAARIEAEEARAAAAYAAAAANAATTTTPPPPAPTPPTTIAPATAINTPPLVAPPPPPPPTPAWTVWDNLAQCESGGNWAMNSGNGFYGGVQFMQSTWLNMGGGRYADYPHQASREQQIEVASRLQAQYGWGQWPACAAQLGLL